MHTMRTRDGGYPLKGRLRALTRRKLKGFCHPGKGLHFPLSDFMRESLWKFGWLNTEDVYNFCYNFKYFPVMLSIEWSASFLFFSHLPFPFSQGIPLLCLSREILHKYRYINNHNLFYINSGILKKGTEKCKNNVILKIFSYLYRTFILFSNIQNSSITVILKVYQTVLPWQSSG